MLRMILVRLASLLGVLLLLTVAVFAIQRFLPADPVKAFFGRNSSAAVLAERRHALGYDRSLVGQYAKFLGDLVHGDLGTSLRTRQSVTSDISRFLPATLELAAVAAVIALGGGLAFGLIGSRRGTASGVVRVLSVVLSSAPTFLVGILGILIFYRSLSWLPAAQRSQQLTTSSPTGFLLIDTLLHGDWSGFSDACSHLVMPATVLAIGPAVAIGRTLRGSLRDVMGDEYVHTARAKGLSESRVLVRHGLRNALNPTLSMAGLQLGLLLSGAIVVEVVFSWPGLGLYLNQSIRASDFPAVIGVVLVLGVGYLLVNAVVDLAQLVVDPRLTVER